MADAAQRAARPEASLRDPALAARGIRKRFGGALALDGVSLELAAGEVHALVGQNGAGKSTLAKVLAGLVVPDEGQLLLEGTPVRWRSPRDAQELGVTFVHQEILVVGELSVLENVFLGFEKTRFGILPRRELRRRFAAVLERTGFDLDPAAIAGELRASDQQKVEILRAMVREPRIIVFDEPTTALTAVEADRLHDTIRRLRDQGTTVVYVSHDLEDVLALSDRVTVLKDGALVQTLHAAEVSTDQLITAMLGRSLTAIFPDRGAAPADAPVVLALDGVGRDGVISDVSFSVRAGEIVGLAGLVGSGRTEVARAVFGADTVDEGTITINGDPASLRSPRDAVSRGIALVPESRRDQGLVMSSSTVENLSLPALRWLTRRGVIARASEREAVRQVIERLDVRMLSAEADVATLSGGNQQKVVFGKWLIRSPAVLIADEPTRGVDVGSKQAIYELIVGLAAEGTAVLVISSDLEEVMGLAHRILVMCRGRISAELPGDADEDQILTAAFPEGRAHEAHALTKRRER